MTKLHTCRYNIDTNRVETRFEDGTIVAIDCIAVEDEYGNTPAQRAEEGGHYLSLGCDHGRLED